MNIPSIDKKKSPRTTSSFSPIDSIKIAIEKFSPEISSFLVELIKNTASLTPQCFLGTPLNESFGTLLYIGTSSRKAGFWFDEFCGHGSKRENLGHKWFTAIVGTSFERTINPDYIVFEESSFNCRYLRTTNGFRIPEWVEMAIDRSNFDSGSKWHRLGIRLLAENKLVLRADRSSAMLDFFYDCLYAPYAIERHTDKAFLYSKSSFLSELDHSDIFFLDTPHETISALFVVYESNERAYLRAIGFDKSALERARWQVGDALYSLVIQELFKKNITRISMGGVHPFFNNGLAWYKMKWDARPAPEIHPTSSWFRFLVQRSTPGVIDFLSKNPFWYYNALDGLNLALISETGQPEPLITKKMTQLNINNRKHLRFNECVN